MDDFCSGNYYTYTHISIHERSFNDVSFMFLKRFTCRRGDTFRKILCSFYTFERHKNSCVHTYEKKAVHSVAKSVNKGYYTMNRLQGMRDNVGRMAQINLIHFLVSFERKSFRFDVLKEPLCDPSRNSTVIKTFLPFRQQVSRITIRSHEFKSLRKFEHLPR